MRTVKPGLQIEKDFELFVMENCGAPDGGTASSYRRAMELLKKVFSAKLPVFAPMADVWAMSDPSVIMKLYEDIKKEQEKFKSGHEGIFGPYAGRGDSYYRKGWCSAALRFFAQFRAAAGYEPRFAAVLASSSNGATVAANAKKIKLGDLAGYLPDGVDVTTKEGKEVVKAVKQRIGQQQFRKWILGIYNGKCCVTGLDIPQVLRASHIVAWADDAKNRMNPANGLCLSATYDAAFDKHLITFDEHYKMVLSKSLRDHCTVQVLKDYFLNFEGKRIGLPVKFIPDVDLLAKHREKLVA